MSLALLVTDNHGHQYPVDVRPDRYGKGVDRPVIDIVGAPGAWYASTLARIDDGREPRFGIPLYLDLGQDWYLVPDSADAVKHLAMAYARVGG